MKKQSVSSLITQLAAKRYWYQKIEVDEKETPVFNKEMANTVFYNRGKWDHFIQPLFPFPPAGKHFVECGCNAGLFLLLAAEAGFSMVTGYEGDDHWFQQARFILSHYQVVNPGSYARISLSHARIGNTGQGASESCMMQSSCEPLDDLSLPAADLTLLANVLYWMDRKSALQYIQNLSFSSSYCIVVSVEGSYAKGGPCSSEEVGEAFSENWQEANRILAPPLAQGERGRNMFSILYCSKTRSPHLGYASKLSGGEY